MVKKAKDKTINEIAKELAVNPEVLKNGVIGTLNDIVPWKDETVIVESKDEANVEVKDDTMTVVIEPVESALHKRMRERYEGMQRCDPRGWEANKDALLEKLSKIK